MPTETSDKRLLKADGLSSSFANLWERLKSGIAQAAERGRLRLSAAEVSLLLAALGAGCGLLVGLVVLLFRLLIEGAQGLFLSGQESFQALPPLGRLLLPLAGAGLIGLYLRFIAKDASATGIIHVMNRVSYHQGYLPWRNAITQLVGATLAIVSGHPGGREGPGIHLGAATSSLLGQRLKLPNNTIRTLVACGTAAAIAASFNTPLAGVAFTMEIVLLEYSIAGFLPVILAAVSATAVIQLVYGASPAFEVPALHSMALIELPHVMLTGFTMGLLAAAFTRALVYFSRSARRHGILPRLFVAGLSAGLAGVVLPQVMGVGYDTVNAAITGELGWALLIALALGKLLTATVAIGLGVPAGLIGPVLFIGAMAGGVLGQAAVVFAPDAIASSSLYALIGMGAMMGATLRAPLAALTALLELTGSPGIIFPAMLAIVIATLTASEIFKQDSVFLSLLRAQGLDARGGTFLQSFDRVGIARVMDRRVSVLPRQVERPQLKQALAQNPRWIVIEGNGERFLLPIADLLEYLERDEAPEQPLDLLALPAKRLQAAPIELRATLREALDALRNGGAEALCVVQTTAPGIRRYYGVVTRHEVDDLYLPAGPSHTV